MGGSKFLEDLKVKIFFLIKVLIKLEDLENLIMLIAYNIIFIFIPLIPES